LNARSLLAAVCLILLAIVASAAGPARGDKYFKITVVDRETRRGVPLVELRMVDNVRYYTDSNGVIAFNEPALMGDEVFFHVSSPGYEFPKDGFGNRGKTLKAVAGGSAQLEIDRINIAQRLFRITGADIYADSLLVGQAAPIAKPLLNAHVVGQDSAVNAVYQGKLYWFWGDTNRASYPLGNFDTTGATSILPERGGLDPDRGVDLNYFTRDDGFVRGMAPMPGTGPTWIDGLVTLKDDSGRERMFAAYAKIRGELTPYERGLAEFNPEREQFEKVATFPLDAPFHPGGHTFHHADGGTDYIHFAMPYPLLRVRADADAIKDLASYEGFTCLKVGTRPEQNKLDRRSDGSLHYGWKMNTAPVGPKEQARLIAAGRLKSAEALLQLQDAESGKSVFAHAGSVYWNGYRQRWIMIAVELGGTSLLGEVWFAEADTPVGPWAYARKIVTHDRYSFYNPKQDPMFDKEGGRVIFFEGTYSVTFSGNPNPTPRYDYNQIMYKLDLADPRLVLPAPIYRLSDAADQFAAADGRNAPGGRNAAEGVPYSRPATPAVGNGLRAVPGDRLKNNLNSAAIAFFAPDRPAPSLIPIYEQTDEHGQQFLRTGAASPGPRDAGDGTAKPEPIFYALAADAPNPPRTTTPLYEFISADGQRRGYSTDLNWRQPDYRRQEKPLCRVWRNPMTALDAQFDGSGP
jgi:hypothetical protein